MKNKIFFSIATAGIVAVGVVYFVTHMKDTDVRYDEYVLQKHDVIKTVNVDATVHPDVYRDIVPEVPLRIKDVAVKVNDMVTEGQVLVRLDRDAINAQIRKAQLAVERAEIAENQGRRKSSGLDSREILSLKKASEQARQVRNELYAQAKKMVITAPISGIVTVQNARVGEVATGVMMRIIDPQSLQVEALIPEVDIAKAREGTPVRIVFDAYPDTTVDGVVKTIDVGSVTVQNSTYYRAIIAVKNWRGVVVRDGMHADVDVVFAQEQRALAVPRDFAQKDAQGYFVLVRDNAGSIQKRYFTTGLIGDTFISVRNGLVRGQVILHAQ